LELDESIDNLYDRISVLEDLDRLNILFIKGIEQSIFAYEDREVNDINLRSRSLQYSGTWHSVPRVLGHLNLSRERFRDNFKFCIVFLLPEFALSYFIRRAPDFFDWRSNIYDFPTEESLVDQESHRLVSLDGSIDEYRQLTQQQRIAKLCQIKSYIDESSDPTRISELWFEKGNIHEAAKEHEAAIKSYDQALQIKPDNRQAWNNRGKAIVNLDRYEEAITSYDKALQIEPNYAPAWSNRGNALRNLGRYEEAIESYDKALQIEPTYHLAWNNRGHALRSLNRYEEAIASFDKTLEIRPNYIHALNGRSNALRDLGRQEEALISIDKVLEVKPEDHYAWNCRGNFLRDLCRYEEAIQCYDKAMLFKPDYHQLWFIRGILLGNSYRNEKNKNFNNKDLKIEADNFNVHYNKACIYSLQNNPELSLESLQKSLQINREKSLSLAKLDSDFDNIRSDLRFQELMQSEHTP